MSDFHRVAGEYKTAYEQLKHTERKAAELAASLQRDLDLAQKRYDVARKAYCELALGEDDEFQQPEEDGASQPRRAGR
jgi:hypothetical protein